MNAKNIVQQAVTPTQSRASRRRGELPPYTYHVLKVKPFGSKRSRAQGDAGLADPVAIHWVRGHFKTYTAERPLLGKFVGRYWFQPHLAGRDESRVADKDYTIQATGEGAQS